MKQAAMYGRNWGFWLPYIMILPVLLFSPVKGVSDPGFTRWIEEFYGTARKAGISRQTFDMAFEGVTEPDAKVLKKAAYQPEFKLPVWEYLDARVNSLALGAGGRMAQKHLPTLALVEQRFGVSRHVLLAIWSMETSYGAVLENRGRLHYVPRALATLAYGDKRRQKFATDQLVAALSILQRGDIDRRDFIGSWAGAMGHTQFIPSSYLLYGVDMDGDGRQNIWGSVPDALATAANLLAENGWRTGETWGYEVVAPTSSRGLLEQTKTLEQWRRLGFVRTRGRFYPRPDDRAELKLPSGEKGPAFLVLKNFFVLKRYNNSDFYALAVGLLADRLAGGSGLAQHWPRPAKALRAEEKLELQRLLQQRGAYGGKVDGLLGPETRAAIRSFQQQSGLGEDGAATIELLQMLRSSPR